MTSVKENLVEGRKCEKERKKESKKQNSDVMRAAKKSSTHNASSTVEALYGEKNSDKMRVPNFAQP